MKSNGLDVMTRHPKKLPVSLIKRLEAKLIALGFTERLLIENASSNLAHEICALSLGTRALVVAGKGNNGADSLAAARKLLSRGYSICAVIVSEDALTEEVNFQKKILCALGVRVMRITGASLATLSGCLRRCDFVIDGLLGTGARGKVSALLHEVISQVNASRRPIVACDIPSGLSPDDGTPLGIAIRADYTVTFLAEKKGFSTSTGRQFCGKVKVVDIGVSRELLQKRSSIRRTKRRPQ